MPTRKGAAFVAVRRRDGAVWLRRRTAKGMLSGMSEPPSSAWNARADGATGAGAAPFSAAWRPCGPVAHGFTHFKLDLEVWRADVDADPPIDGWWSEPADQAGEALPTLMRKVLKSALSNPADSLS